jgi:hypothetical protein
MVRITVGPLVFTAQWQERAAPRTCEAFRRLLPFRREIIHARWSGEACWIPLGDFDLGVGYENHTSRPSAGDILFHPRGRSEAEVLFAYGSVRFAAEVGPLAGNHFLTVVDGRDNLGELGRLVLWRGAQPIVFEEGCRS